MKVTDVLKTASVSVDWRVLTAGVCERATAVPERIKGVCRGGIHSASRKIVSWMVSTAQRKVC